ncbi:MAG: hypothetical protein WAM27_09540 [Nitrososphaeraceae archaeon]
MESSCGLITSKLNEKFRVGNRGVECRISFVERFAGAFVLPWVDIQRADLWQPSILYYLISTLDDSY